MEPIPDRPLTAPASTTPVPACGTIADKSSDRFGWLLVAILLVGFALRVGFIGHKVYNTDERIAQAVVQNLSFPEQWDTNWIKTNVGFPFQYDQYNFSSYHYLLYFWKSLVAVVGLDRLDQPGALRALNGLLGLVFMGTVVLAARASLGKIAGIAAACAGAVLPLFVEDAHYLRCEAMLTAGLSLLLWLAVRSGPTSRRILFASGFLAGWLLACKASMGIALPLLLIILHDTSGFKPVRVRTVFLLFGILAAGLILGVVAGMPWGVAHPQLYLSGLAKLALHYRSPWPPYTTPDMAPSIWVTLEYMKGTLGAGFWAVTALGLIPLIKTARWWRATLLVLPLATALAVFGSHPFFAERSYSPFLPIAVLLFGAGAHFLVASAIRLKPQAQRYTALLLTLLLAGTLMIPARYSSQLVFQIFSGREQSEKDAALASMKGNLTGKVVRMQNVAYYPESFRALEASVANHGPVLIVVVDYYDPITPTCLTTLQNKYGAAILGVREGIFPGLPPCFLNTIMSPRLWLLHIPANKSVAEPF